MITLLTIRGDARLPSLSPFCVKAMCLLEMASEDWEPDYSARMSDMPYGKLPVIRHNGTLLPDSGNLQRFLEARGADFHPGMGDAQRAQSRAFQRLAENSLRMGLVYDRWIDDAGWAACRETMFAGVPEAMRAAVADPVRETIRKALTGEGFARFSPEDRLAVMNDDLKAVEAMLLQGKFLLGDVPTAADASLVPVLDMLANLPAETALQARVVSEPRLMDYIAAGRAALYPSEAQLRKAGNRTAA